MKKITLLGALLLFVFPQFSFSQAVDLCEGNFDCDGDVDGMDAFIFKEDFGRTPYNDPCPPCVPTTTTMPTLRFIDNGDGTVTDGDSDLVWLKNALCNELNDSGNGLSWYDATTAVAHLASGSCGLTDGSTEGEWRLPTKEEWEAFVCVYYQEPAICNTQGTGQWSEEDPFTNVQLFFYWTHTLVESNTNSSWTVFTNYGILLIGRNSSKNYSWPVRSNQ
jgi:hypothetical protein